MLPTRTLPKSEIRRSKSERNPNSEFRKAGRLLSRHFAIRISAFGLRILAVAVLAACLLSTRHQLRYWQNTETLMGRALEIDPGNYIAHNDLAVYYDKHGRAEEARQHRQRVRELDPALQGKGR